MTGYSTRSLVRKLGIKEGRKVLLVLDQRTKDSGSPPSGVLGENRVRELGLAVGLVDVKVCAVDETWSGLNSRTVARIGKPPRRGSQGASLEAPVEAA